VGERKPTQTLQWKQTAVEAVAFSPDGRLVAAAGTVERLEGAFRKTGGIVRICEVAGGRELITLAGHPDAVHDVAFAPDGGALATASADGTARLWDVAQGQELRALKGHQGAVRAVAFAADGQSLTTAGADGTVRLWNVAGGAERRILRGHTGAVLGIALSPDGQTLATAGSDKTVQLWDPSTGKVRHRLPSKTPALSVAFSPDGKVLAAGSGVGERGELTLWDSASGKRLATAAADKGRCSAVVFSPDGRWLAAAVIGDAAAPGDVPRGEVRLWEVRALLANAR
jgi:WD40 repeat protein